MTPRPHVGMASYNSVVNNQVGWDISFHTRDTQRIVASRRTPPATPPQTSWQPYNDGTYDFLTSDPNP